MQPTAPKASLRQFFESGWRSLMGDGNVVESGKPAEGGIAMESGKAGGCGHDCSCGKKNPETGAVGAQANAGLEQAGGAEMQGLLSQPISRRQALGHMLKGAMAGAGAMAIDSSAGSSAAGSDKASGAQSDSDVKSETARLKFEEYLKKNYRIMTKAERKATVKRLERLSRLNRGVESRISTKEPVEGVLFGYAFNISKCKGYMDCVKACQEENNQDRKTGIQYITIHEMEPGQLGLHSSNKQFFHEVPADGHFYLGTQCFHCENPPCTKVCPVGATWKEKDGIVVIDYDWCIGCRYCEAACPYFGRRFNWGEPEVPAAEVNPNQHYLGNRPRVKGVMEKCTFCVQRSREGRQPACVEACPTGARVFGNLLDPKSEIRWVLDNKKVFRFKEELGTEPKFWYYMD